MMSFKGKLKYFTPVNFYHSNTTEFNGFQSAYFGS